MSHNNLSGRARIRVRKPPSQVFAAFANPGSMSKFWFTRRDPGLKQGETALWALGVGEDAMSFDVRVEELLPPNRLVVSWEREGAFTQVTWTFEETRAGDTILSVEESGFKGSEDSIVEQVLDSTGGFNQVVVAAKAFVEYGVALNVVADHA